MLKTLRHHFSSGATSPSIAHSASTPAHPATTEPRVRRSPAPRFRPTRWDAKQIRALAGKKILWNEAYPGIYLRAHHRDSNGDFLKMVSDRLNRLAATTEGHALLAGISAAHLAHPAIELQILPLECDFYAPPRNEHDAYYWQRVRGGNGRHYGGRIYINVFRFKTDTLCDVEQVLCHELNHAYVDLWPRFFTMDGDACAAHDRGVWANEEFYVMGAGNHMGKAPMSQLRNTLLEGRRLQLGYGENLGYDIPTPDERNSGDEAIFPAPLNSPTNNTVHFVKTSQNSQDEKEREADHRFFTDQLTLLATCSATIGSHAESLMKSDAVATDGITEVLAPAAFSNDIGASSFDPRMMPTLRDKHRAQETIFREAIHLAQANRYSAAHRLVKFFPADMLSHLDHAGHRRIEVDTVKRLIGTRYAESVEKQLANIRINDMLAAYQSYVDLYALAAKSKKPLMRNGREELRTPQEYIRDLDAHFEEIWCNAMKPVARNTQSYRNLDFERNLFDVGAKKLAELFYYRQDRSERVSAYMEVLARTPSSVFQQTT
ncbi:hypothetical protein [Imbroritus primus]|uniref:hypothetical protein n=1 Tax=Imbroritus primus TaxID=3058603 RepID=UPI003D160D61